MENLKINIKATELDLTNEIRNRVEEKILKIGKIIDLSGDKEATADVEVAKKYGEHHKKGDVYYAEVNFRYQGKTYRAESTKSDIFAAIEKISDEVKRNIKRDKERKNDLSRRGGKKIKDLFKFGR